jgi:hypothetical protein
MEQNQQNSQQNSQQPRLKAAAMSDVDFHRHVLGDDDDTVVVAAFGVFTRKDVESMKMAGYTPITIIGKDAGSKVTLEPFIIVGHGIDAFKMFTGFVSQVWRRYSSDRERHEKEKANEKSTEAKPDEGNS